VTRNTRIAISIPDAARLIGTSRSTAYEWAKRGELPTVRMGGRQLVPLVPLCKKFGVDPTLFGISRADLADATDA
jgi:excisionase family DNA binding protein